jgi:hypothetical protein
MYGLSRFNQLPTIWMVYQLHGFEHNQTSLWEWTPWFESILVGFVPPSWSCTPLLESCSLLHLYKWLTARFEHVDYNHSQLCITMLSLILVLDPSFCVGLTLYVRFIFFQFWIPWLNYCSKVVSYCWFYSRRRWNWAVFKSSLHPS